MSIVQLRSGKVSPRHLRTSDGSKGRITFFGKLLLLNLQVKELLILHTFLFQVEKCTYGSGYWYRLSAQHSWSIFPLFYSINSWLPKKVSLDCRSIFGRIRTSGYKNG
jgi:hypothetical protein